MNGSNSRRKPRGSPVTERLADEDTVWLGGGSATGRVMAHTVTARLRETDVRKDVHRGDASWRRRQLSHDIRHEIATITLLASLLRSAPDVGPDSRQRAGQILGEARWLEQLHRAYDETLSEPAVSVRADVEVIRLDEFAAEVVTAAKLSSSTEISYTCQDTWARVDGLAFWRALRNMVSNAVRAAGSTGRVDVRVDTVAGRCVVQVDDDGPGFGASAPGLGAYGLDIVQEFAAAWRGDLEIGPGSLGGCFVRLRLPAAVPPPATSIPGGGDARTSV